MLSMENVGFTSYIKFFLSLTLLYNITFSQILMKKLGIRIFIIATC